MMFSSISLPNYNFIPNTTGVTSYTKLFILNLLIKLLYSSDFKFNMNIHLNIIILIYFIININI